MTEPQHAASNRTANQPTPATVRAAVGGTRFSGQIVGRAHDGGPVVYVEDADGHVRAVRPQHPRHNLWTPDDDDTDSHGGGRA